MFPSELSAIAALLFVLPALYTFGFQMAVTLGAPFGDLTMGGRWPGVLPLKLRPLSFLQGLIALAMMVAVLEEGGVVTLGWPGWTYTATLALSALSVIANAATPSKPERKHGLPVAMLLLVTAALTGFL